MSEDILKPNQYDMSSETSSLGIEVNLGGLLAYLFGFVTGIVFLILEKDSKFIRFHAMQSTLFFLAIFVLNIVFGFIPFVGWILVLIVEIIGVIFWIYAMIKAYNGYIFKVPIIGDIAANQLQ